MPLPVRTVHLDAQDEPPPRDRLWTLCLTVPDGRILSIGSALAEALGRPPESLVAQPSRELFHPREWAGICRRLEDAMLLGSDTFGAVALRSEAGAWIWVEIQAAYRLQQQHLELSCRLLAPVATNDPVGSPPPQPSPGRRIGSATAAEPWSSSPGVAPTPLGDDARLPAAHRAATGVSSTSARPSAPTVPPASPAVSSSRSRWLEPPGSPVLGVPNLAGPSLVMVMAALESAAVAATAVAADGTVVSATVACERLFGIPIARLRGRELAALLELPAADAKHWHRARQERRRHTLQLQPFAGHGPWTLVWLPETTPGAGYAILLADLPPAEISQAERAQTRLVSFVAHDVREVLANLYCGLRLLSEDLPADAPQRPTVDRLLVDSSRACRIVDDVLAVSRPGRLSCVPLDLAEVVHETLARYRPRAAAAGIEVRESLTPGLVVNADLSGLERAFGNLIENAIEATPLAGTLAVRLEPEDRHRPGVRVSITDTGMGIPAAIQPNLFEPFVSGKARGTGLGLASTRRIVTDHEGTIDFETQVGRGTTFHVWLPRIEASSLGPEEKEVSE